MSIDVYKHSMDLTCVVNVWHGLQLSQAEDTWHMTHVFLTHKCMFGLARLQVRLALHIFNTNNNALLMVGCSFTLKILHLWKLLCYFELVSWCIHKFHKITETLRIHTNEVCKSTYHIFDLLLGCNNSHWAQSNHVLDYILNLVAICDEYMLPWHICITFYAFMTTHAINLRFESKVT